MPATKMFAGMARSYTCEIKVVHVAGPVDERCRLTGPPVQPGRAIIPELPFTGTAIFREPGSPR